MAFSRAPSISSDENEIERLQRVKDLKGATDDKVDVQASREKAGPWK